MLRSSWCLLALLFAVRPLCAATRTWTGSCFPAVWSNAPCWSGGVAPASGDTLDFVSPGGTFSSNDYPPGTAFGPITLNGFIGGNGIVLNGGLTTSGGTDRLILPIRLGGSQSWVIGFGSQLIVSGGLDLNGAHLDLSSPLAFVTIDSPISGTGTIVAAPNADLRVMNATSSMIGTLASFLRNVTVDAANIPGANILGNFGSADILNNATVGNVTISEGLLLAGSAGQNHIANTQNLSFINGANLVEAYLDSAAPGGAFHLNVHGSVTLSGTALDLRSPNSFPGGTTFTLIDNDGTEAVIGTFTGLPEGASITATSGQTFRISYRGGTGNDVVLTVISGPNVPAIGGWLLGALTATLGALALLRLRG